MVTYTPYIILYFVCVHMLWTRPHTSIIVHVVISQQLLQFGNTKVTQIKQAIPGVVGVKVLPTATSKTTTLLSHAGSEEHTLGRANLLLRSS